MVIYMKQVCLLTLILALASPVSAQLVGGYEVWSTWTPHDKATFAGGALSQAPKICEVIAAYQVRNIPDSTYTSLFYECMMERYSYAMDVLEIRNEIDILYKNLENRKKSLATIYRDVIIDRADKKKKQHNMQ